MAKVVYIRDGQSEREVRLGIRCDGETVALLLGVGFLSELAPIALGDEIDEDTLRLLTEEDERRRCMKKALAILAYADNSKKTLYAKLRRAGYSAELSRECVLSCASLGYIDERAQLLRLVKSEACGSLRGPRLIRAKLASRGYATRDIEDAIDELTSSGEVDFDESLERLYERYSDGSEETKQKIKYKYGY